MYSTNSEIWRITGRLKHQTQVVENICRPRHYDRETRTVQASTIRVRSGNTCIKLWKINEPLKRFPRTVSRYDFPCSPRKTLGEHNCIRVSRQEEKAFFGIKPSTQRPFGNSHKNRGHEDSNCDRMTWIFFLRENTRRFCTNETYRRVRSPGHTPTMPKPCNRHDYQYATISTIDNCI